LITARYQLPVSHAVEDAFTSLLSPADALGRVTILSRRRNVYSTTSPSEVIRCKLPDGREMELFCKYGASRDRDSHGHRRGVPYEALVYRRILHPSQSSVPALFGAYVDAPRGQTWLVIENIAGGWRMDRTPDPLAMSRAARWIGEFHRQLEERATADEMSFLTRYDCAFYEGWARRTVRFAAPLLSRYPWLTTLCEGFPRVASVLLAPHPTIIHGECYPQNILVRDGAVYPVDWESAAIGPGEIDLASLTERWPREIAEQCEVAYRYARWPQGLPDYETDRTLAAARLYLHLRWLGDQPGRTNARTTRWRFSALRGLGEQLGLL
jgi:hypothetical protein